MVKKTIGKEVRQVASIRIEPKVKAKLIKKYGSIQKFFNLMLVKGDK